MSLLQPLVLVLVLVLSYLLRTRGYYRATVIVEMTAEGSSSVRIHSHQR